MARTLVLGVGNILLRDEGAGIHAVRRLAGNHRGDSRVEFLDGGTLGIALAPALEHIERLIVFDAAEIGAPPGTVECFVDGEMDSFLRTGRRSVHEVGLVDILNVARLQGHLPPERALIGIQPGTIEWGDATTGPVRNGIERAVELAAELLAGWPSSSDRAQPERAALR